MVSHELGFITLIWVHSWRSQRGLQVSTSGFQMFRCGAEWFRPTKASPHPRVSPWEKKCAEKLWVSSEHHTPASSLQSHQHLLLWHQVCHVFIQPQSPFLFMSISLFMLLDKASCILGWSLIHRVAENKLERLSLLHPSPWDYSQSPPYLVCVMLWTQLSVWC